MIDNKNRWKPHEIELLRKLVDTGKTAEEIAEKVGRSELAVRSKARKLNLVILGNTKRNWTTEEITYLQENWGQVSLNALSKNLFRSNIAIRQQATKMGLGRAADLTEYVRLSEFCEYSGLSWMRIIRGLVPTHDFPVIRKTVSKKRQYFVQLEAALEWMQAHQDLFDASRVSPDLFIPEPEWLIQKRRQDATDKSHIKSYALVKREWTPEEDARLRDLIKLGHSYSDIAKEFGLTKKQISRRAGEKGYSWTSPRFWRGSDFKFIQEHWETMTDEEIAKHLNKTASGVAVHRESLGLFRSELKSRFTKEDEDFIREHYLEMTDKALGQAIGHSTLGIHRYREEHGLLRPKQSKHYTPEEKQYIYDNWQEKTDAEIAAHLGRKEEAIGQFRWKRKLIRRTKREEESP